MNRIMIAAWVTGFFCIPPVLAAEPVDVFVSVPPQKFFVQYIGGEQITVRSLVPNGVRPDTFEPSVADIRSLAMARLFFLIGVPYEQVWVEVFRERFPDLHLIECCDGVHFIRETHGGHHEWRDPHIWTSPRQAMYLARTVYRALVAYRPESQAIFSDNLSKLQQALDRLDQTIRSSLQPLRTRIIIVAHPSLGYFAREYGLEQLGLETHGRELRAATLLARIAQAKREAVRQVHVQPQFSQHAARALAGELGARLVVIDPLSEDYLKAMEHIGRVIRNAVVDDV